MMAGRPTKRALLQRLLASLCIAAAPAWGQEAPASDEVTTVEALTVTAAPVPQVGPGAPLFTAAEIQQKGFVARANREVVEDGRAKIAECYMSVFGYPPYSIRMLGYEDAANAA